MQLLLRATYLTEQLLLSTPVYIGFLPISWWATHNIRRVGTHTTRVSTSGVRTTARIMCAHLLTGAPTRFPISSANKCTRTPSNGVFIRQRGSYFVGLPRCSSYL